MQLMDYFLFIYFFEQNYFLFIWCLHLTGEGPSLTGLAGGNAQEHLSSFFLLGMLRHHKKKRPYTRWDRMCSILVHRFFLCYSYCRTLMPWRCIATNTLTQHLLKYTQIFVWITCPDTPLQEMFAFLQSLLFMLLLLFVVPIGAIHCLQIATSSPDSFFRTSTVTATSFPFRPPTRPSISTSSCSWGRPEQWRRIRCRRHKNGRSIWCGVLLLSVNYAVV